MPNRYRIEFRRSAAKELRAIGREADRRRIIDRIEALAGDPRPPGCVKLTGRDAYRVRQGVYRIVYTVADDRLVIEVVKAERRRDAYR